MKKKTMAVGGLLLAVAMTGYSVAGTYAKYTSKIDLTDEARVARWDFKLTSNNTLNSDNTYKLDLFANSYKLESPTDSKGNKVWVKSFDGANVVAPGTKGKASFELTGMMETAFTIDYNMSAENDFIVYYVASADGKTVVDMNKDKNVLLATYADTNIKEYRPLTYTITHTRNNVPVTVINDKLKDKNAAELATEFAKYNENNAKHLDTHIFTPSENPYVLAFDIDWKWNTTNTVGDLEPAEVDRLDTYAGENLYNQTVTFKISVVANQVAEDYSVKAN